jgi:hypothetical protein
MALADSLKQFLQTTGRAIPGALGLRPTRVFVRSRTWSSGKIQTGTPTIANLEILPTPRVTATAGDPSMRIGPITPAYQGPPAGGYTTAQLNPGDAPGFEHVYILLGPDGVERAYKLLKLSTTRALHYTLELQSFDRVVPY